MNQNEISEYVEYALKIAEYQCETSEEAQDICQEALLALLLALQRGSAIEHPKAWLSSVIHRKYADLLREKYQKPVTYIGVEFQERTADCDALDEIIKTEDFISIRRQVARLSKLYREVIVRYYLKNQKVKQIAAELGVSENTVKSRLDMGRKHIRKGLKMSSEKYVKQSMEPDDLWISFAGISGEDMERVWLDKIAMNLLLLAYEKPVEISDLAAAIGIPCAYIEPITDKLVHAQLMKRTANRVYTDFIIFSPSDCRKNFALEKAYAASHYKEAALILNKYFSKAEQCIKTDTKGQRESLRSYLAVRALINSMMSVRNELSPKICIEDYPERPNGGKWYCQGYYYPAGFDYENDEKSRYLISGECGSSYPGKDKKGRITLLEFDTCLGETRKYWNRLSDDHPELRCLELLYCCQNSEEELFTRYGLAVNEKVMERIDVLIEGRFLTKDKKVNIPVLNRNEFGTLLELAGQCERELKEKFHDIYLNIYQKGRVETPKHLKNIPEFQRYMFGESFPMLVLLQAKAEHMLFDESGQTPAVIMVIEE